MIKYTGHYITLQEVPDEVSLTLTISNCQGRCEGCHSPWLREDIGDDLEKDLPGLLDKYGDAITCVCFMGEGKDLISLNNCIKMVDERGLKTAVYTGDNRVGPHSPTTIILYGLPNYIKTGSYQKDLGGLDRETTNQRMYVWDETALEYSDITHKFWRKKDE